MVFGEFDPSLGYDHPRVVENSTILRSLKRPASDLIVRRQLIESLVPTDLLNKPAGFSPDVGGVWDRMRIVKLWLWSGHSVIDKDLESPTPGIQRFNERPNPVRCDT